VRASASAIVAYEPPLTTKLLRGCDFGLWLIESLIAKIARKYRWYKALRGIGHDDCEGKEGFLRPIAFHGGEN
jgi:hypothetical protein